VDGLDQHMIPLAAAAAPSPCGEFEICSLLPKLKQAQFGEMHGNSEPQLPGNDSEGTSIALQSVEQPRK
jgi:hypothetical protein